MPDYSKSLIYKIVCKDTSVREIYVGHTTNYRIRYNCHKSWGNNVKSSKYNLKVYKYIREHGGWDNWEMVELYKYPCNSKKEIIAEERRAYDRFNAKLNTFKPNRSKEEYFIDTRDIRVQKWHDNKIEILAKQAEKKRCECGIFYTHNHKKRHTDTQLHKKRMADLAEGKVLDANKLECECGVKCSDKYKLTEHKKTAKHAKRMENIANHSCAS